MPTLVVGMFFRDSHAHDKRGHGTQDHLLTHAAVGKSLAPSEGRIFPNGGAFGVGCDIFVQNIFTPGP
jgi:hypothetical protein